jgi:hypothetical protein
MKPTYPSTLANSLKIVLVLTLLYILFELLAIYTSKLVGMYFGYFREAPNSFVLLF